MTQAKSGDTVRITYVGTSNDGETFDNSEGRDPLEFVVGSGQIIRGLDAAISGMSVGDKKDVAVPCDQAYGQSNPEARCDWSANQNLTYAARLCRSDQMIRLRHSQHMKPAVDPDDLTRRAGPGIGGQINGGAPHGL